MDPASILIQLLNGLAFSMLLFLLAAGLSIIFGLMDFLNLAHGSFYMLGAYLAFQLVDPQRLGLHFGLALLVAPLLVGALALALDRSVLRRVHRAGHLVQVLLTFGLALVVADLVRWTWGADIRSVPPPPELRGAVPLFDAAFPRYRLFVIAAGLLLAAGMWFVHRRTQLGALIRAGVDDKEMLAALGVNIDRVSSLVFAAGAAIAALAGVIAGPYLSLQPGMDFETLILSLLVVVIGGLGTLKGSFFGALLVGLVDSVGKGTRVGDFVLADYSLMLVFVVMAAVLLLRPAGLFGRAV
ncbi:MAG: branched-chain amino acid ABC transporter permease [Chloroflexota bacterium]|nr:branched-chain amino acid ABC transporter permease [Chloroflexota bacterium]